MSRHRLVGYDRRVAIESVGANWTPERRERFLYKPDAPTPLSVDRLVWPEATLAEVNASDVAQSGTAFFDLTGNPPDRSIEEDTCAIAIGVLFQAWSSAQRATWGALALDRTGNPIGLDLLAQQPEWPLRNQDWAFLGYDVADWGLVSALTNCGFLANEPADALRARWSGSLNAYHLFDDDAPATEFAAFANSRVREHAPFYVYGIWTLKE